MIYFSLCAQAGVYSSRVRFAAISSTARQFHNNALTNISTSNIRKVETPTQKPLFKPIQRSNNDLSQLASHFPPFPNHQYPPIIPIVPTLFPPFLSFKPLPNPSPKSPPPTPNLRPGMHRLRFLVPALPRSHPLPPRYHNILQQRKPRQHHPQRQRLRISRFQPYGRQARLHASYPDYAQAVCPWELYACCCVDL